MFIENLAQQIKTSSKSPQGAWTNFLKKPLPTKKLEDWKYTDVTFLDTLDFLSDLDRPYTNVVLNDDQSLSFSRETVEKPLPEIKGCKILRHSDLISSKELSKTLFVNHQWNYSNYFSELIEASQPSTVFLVFDESWSLSSILKFKYEAFEKTSVLSNFDLQIVLNPNSSVRLCEVLKGCEGSMLNVNLNYFISENAALTSVKIDDTPKSRIMTTQRTYVEKNGKYQSVHLTSGTQWARHNTYVQLAGEFAHADIGASYTASGDQFVDHHTFVDHLVGNTTSKQLYSGVISHKATGVYNGKVWIQRDAQQSNAEQLSRNLLLSKTAVANTKPELLIDADDVKAKHGATIGQMDQEELFYMQSRGLTPQKAREMVLKSFVFGVADSLPKNLQELFAQRGVEDIKNFVAELENV